MGGKFGTAGLAMMAASIPVGMIGMLSLVFGSFILTTALLVIAAALFFGGAALTMFSSSDKPKTKQGKGQHLEHWEGAGTQGWNDHGG